MVLDLNMPDMHGMEVIGFVRSHQAYRNIPIVVLTTKDEETSRSEALAAGANRYLTKPFDPRQLADVVGSLLKAN
jgi:two-component system, chemotaxis family, chemotaxis protein CheY